MQLFFNQKAAELAKKVPVNIRFGTSSWTYQGWKGLIYSDRYKNEKDFKANSLAEYAGVPLFRTVGIDSTFYGPPKTETLRRYCEQVGEDFRWIAKVWEQVTIPHFAKHPRYGKFAGKDNPHFLDADKCNNEFLARFEQVKDNCGVFVFQFQTLFGPYQKTPELFFEKLERFLAKLSKDYSYAVEIRNPSFLLKEYFDVLNRCNVTHCFNHWTKMPALHEQMQAAAVAGGLKADFFVSRILTPIGLSYENAVKKFAPYDKLQEAIPAMRADVVRLARRALKTNKNAFIIVNNRSEGHAPTTICEIAEMLSSTAK